MKLITGMSICQRKCNNKLREIINLQASFSDLLTFRQQRNGRSCHSEQLAVSVICNTKHMLNVHAKAHLKVTMHQKLVLSSDYF